PPAPAGAAPEDWSCPPQAAARSPAAGPPAAGRVTHPPDPHPQARRAGPAEPWPPGPAAAERDVARRPARPFAAQRAQPPRGRGLRWLAAGRPAGRSCHRPEEKRWSRAGAFAGLPFDCSCYILPPVQTSVCVHMSDIAPVPARPVPASPDRRPQRPGRHGPRFRMVRTVTALMLREIATTYGRSVGGYIWAILEPVLGVALLSVLFSLALRSPGLGSNFPLFYATGFLPFAMFHDLSSKTAAAIRFSRPFL